MAALQTMCFRWMEFLGMAEVEHGAKNNRVRVAPTSTKGDAL
jgi:hypothetical protein